LQIKTKAPQTVQQSIPYRAMYRDGICRVNERLFTKTVAFQDVNYHLAQPEDQAVIFEGWGSFLNYFDSSISVQLSFINRFGRPDEYKRSILFPHVDARFDSICREYADMLQNQLAKGNNGLNKTKYITFGVQADDLRTAKLRLERVEVDVLNNFKALGVAANPLNGLERLEVLHG